MNRHSLFIKVRKSQQISFQQIKSIIICSDVYIQQLGLKVLLYHVISNFLDLLEMCWILLHLPAIKQFKMLYFTGQSSVLYFFFMEPLTNRKYIYKDTFWFLKSIIKVVLLIMLWPDVYILFFALRMSVGSFFKYHLFTCNVLKHCVFMYQLVLSF